MPFHITTVCTGNICRSPMAEVVLRRRFAEAGLGDDVVVTSAGTSDEEHGNPVDRRARAVLTAAGYDVPQHRAHQARREEVDGSDLLLAMTARHARWLRSQDPGAGDRVRLYRSFDPAAPSVDGAGGEESVLDIEDPWYGDQSDFETTLEQVEAGADGVVEHVRARLGR